MNTPSLEHFFSQKILAPLRERDKEARTNKEFYLGAKQYEYIPTLVGHEPVVDYPNENFNSTE